MIPPYLQKELLEDYKKGEETDKAQKQKRAILKTSESQPAFAIYDYSYESSSKPNRRIKFYRSTQEITAQIVTLDSEIQREVAKLSERQIKVQRESDVRTMSELKFEERETVLKNVQKQKIKVVYEEALSSSSKDEYIKEIFITNKL